MVQPRICGPGHFFCINRSDDLIGSAQFFFVRTHLGQIIHHGFDCMLFQILVFFSEFLRNALVGHIADVVFFIRDDFLARDEKFLDTGSFWIFQFQVSMQAHRPLQVAAHLIKWVRCVGALKVFFQQSDYFRTSQDSS